MGKINQPGLNTTVANWMEAVRWLLHFQNYQHQQKEWINFQGPTPSGNCVPNLQPAKPLVLMVQHAEK